MKKTTVLFLASISFLSVLRQTNASSVKSTYYKQIGNSYGTAQSYTELKQLAASLRNEAEHLDRLAKNEDLNLTSAYEHHIGGPKYPSNADHARVMARVYRDRSAKCLAKAKELEARAEHSLANL